MRIQETEKISPQRYFHDVEDQLKRHVYDRSEAAFAVGDAARDAVQSADALKARQEFIRSKFIESLGGLPPSDTPLNPRVVGTVEGDGFRIEKIIFE